MLCVLTLTSFPTWFDYVSLLMVLLNCVSLGMYKPCEEQSDKLQILDAFIFTFFVMEMLIKAVALGIVGHEESLFSNNWNKFDVFIICGEVLDHFLASLGILSGLRVFSPMRLIGRVPSMRVLVTDIVNTLPMLVNVLVLYIFVIHIFGVMGVQMWAGQLRNRCFMGEEISTKYNISLSPYYATKYGEKNPFICSPKNKNGMRHCRDVPPSTEDGVTCLLDPRHQDSLAVTNSCVNWNVYYNVCRAGDHNPQEDAISFDNIGFAWIAIFQAVTLEGWTEIMYYVMDANSFWSFVFFVLVTIIGSFVMMNLCAVVIVTQFSETERETDELHVGLSIKRLLDKFKSFILCTFSRLSNNSVNLTGGGGGRNASLDAGQSPLHSNSSVVQACKQLKEQLKRVVESRLFDQAIMLTVFLCVLAIAIEHHEQPKELTNVLQISNIVFVLIFVVEMVLKLLAVTWAYFKDRNNVFYCIIIIISLLGMYLFGCKFSFKTVDGDTIIDRKNFDSLLWSMVTVFQILTEEDWNLVLYNAMSATSPWSALYFVALIILGKLVILNVLLGIAVKSYRVNHSSSTNHSLSSENDVSQTDNEEHSPSRPEQPCSVSFNLPDESVAINPPAAFKDDERRLNFPWKVLRWCKEREEWSFYVLSPHNRFRICCQHVISHQNFDRMVLLFILLSCVNIALERPGIDPDSMERWILKTSRYVFSAVFFIEMLFKVLALGLLFGKESYCRSPWNIVDGSLVILSSVHIIVSLVYTDKDNVLDIVKVLRLLRVLRPLRVIKRAPRLKLAVEALIASVKPITNIILICSIFFFFFGILGVQLFKGKFYHCVGRDIRAITNKSECLSSDYRWERKTFNFDNLPQALMSLFVMYSKDGWVNIMYDGLDAVGVHKQPVRNHNSWMLIFFISFMIVSIFLLDMFISIMVDTFHECQQKQRRNVILPTEGGDEDQANRGEAGLHMQLTEYSYYVFTAIHIVEVLLKIVSFGALRFMKNRWNLLDVAVVVVSIVSIFFTEMKMVGAIPVNPNILRVCRVLRLTQVLKAKKIRVLLETIMKMLSQVGNLCLLFTFFFLIYAALGVELFGKMDCTDDHPCLGLHRHSNFTHFGMALLTLYRVCTGDNWSGVLRDTLRECQPGNHYCVSFLFWVSPIFFTSFVIIAQFVLVNLVVAAIMQALQDSNKSLGLLYSPPVMDR
ncbi:hypothetical protein PAMA_022023 [Pampus argenteus]